MTDVSLIYRYFPDLSSTQKKQFEALKALYLEWNVQINVISRKDIDLLYEKHVLHSLGIAKVLSFADGTQVLDVGTGGGFPGIPLAILFPKVGFTLVDSIGKKIKVVKAIAEALDLSNVKAYHMRAEEVPSNFDFVVSRAVTRLVGFIPWVDRKILKNGMNELPNGYLLLKGGDLEDEIAESKKDVIVFELSKYFDSDFFETKKVLYIPK